MSLVLPLLTLGILLVGVFRKTDLMSAFAEGVKEGLQVALRILPILIFMLSAIGAFRASGGMDRIVEFLVPLCSWLHVPPPVLPLALLRPMSGSGAIALLEDLLAQYGADSAIGKLASVLTASTETTLYTLSLYLGNVRKNTGKILFCALCTDVFTVLFAVTVCRFLS